MVNRPVRAKERVRRAWPLASSVTRATTLLPTKNVTVPVGVPLPAGPRTVAVNVTACPTTAGLSDDPTATVVGAGVTVPGLTVTFTTAEVLAGKEPLRRTAFSAAVPTPTAVKSTVAWPLASSNAEPTGVLPAKKLTTPFV